MAVTQSPFTNPVQFGLTIDAVANATAEANIRGGPCTLYSLEVDNTAASAATAYLKFYDATSVVVGTTAPTFILKVKAATTRRIRFGTEGQAFTAGLTMAAVTTGGTGGTSNPADTVIVRLLTS